MVLLWFVVASKHQASHPLFHENSRKFGVQYTPFSDTHTICIYPMGYCTYKNMSDISWDISDISWYFMGYILHFSIIWNLLYIREKSHEISDRSQASPLIVGLLPTTFLCWLIQIPTSIPMKLSWKTPTIGRLNTPCVSICNLLIKDIPWYSHILLIFPVYSQYLRATIMLKTSSLWLPKSLATLWHSPLLVPLTTLPDIAVTPLETAVQASGVQAVHQKGDPPKKKRA